MSKITEFFSLYKTAQILGMRQYQVREMKKKGEIPFIETPYGTRFNIAAMKKLALQNAKEAKKDYQPHIDLKSYRPGGIAYVGR
jgi:hypothetical protein